jgi:hypothetical protein
MDPRTPHYLRFARTLALATTLALPACADAGGNVALDDEAAPTGTTPPTPARSAEPSALAAPPPAPTATTTETETTTTTTATATAESDAGAEADASYAGKSSGPLPPPEMPFTMGAPLGAAPSSAPKPPALQA